MGEGFEFFNKRKGIDRFYRIWAVDQVMRFFIRIQQFLLQSTLLLAFSRRMVSRRAFWYAFNKENAHRQPDQAKYQHGEIQEQAALQLEIKECG